MQPIPVSGERWGRNILFLQAGNPTGKVSAVVSAAAFFLLIFFVFISIAILAGRIKQEVPETLSGHADLTKFDFDGKLAYISHTSFVYYKDALYTPEDFRLERVKSKPVIMSSTQSRFDPGHYGTYRVLLVLPDSRTYGLSSYSAMYSQRMFINGVEYPAFGTPGKTAETTVTQTKHYTVFFTPVTPEVEIIIQFANFSHYDYGGIVPLYLGMQAMIIKRDAIAQQRVHILIGFTMTAFLFFLGMFFFFHKRHAFLWFSAACLAIGLRTLVVEEKVIMLLWEDLPWEVSIGMEYLSLILLTLTFLLYIHNMFPGALHSVVLWSFGSICALFASSVLLTAPIVYTRFMFYFQLCGALFGIYVLVALVYNVLCRKDNRQAEHVLIFAGALIFIGLSTLDIQIHRSGGYSLPVGLAGCGMVVLIFANMIALTLKFSHTEIELDKTRRSELEMQETNQLLDRMSRLKSDFLATISHEMRTPLTIIASYAGLTSMQIQRDAVNEKTLANLDTIKREAIRLAGLVEQLKEVSLEKERQLELVTAEAITLLQLAADFCEPICLKNKNRLTVTADCDKALLRVNADSIFQTLVNLIINANRHTREGTIRLHAEDYEPESSTCFLKITVSDDGDGIDSKLLPSLFQRGVSGDGSSGLGLAICKELIEEHGGKIWIESEKGRGTVCCLTLPRWKGEGQP